MRKVATDNRILATSAKSSSRWLVLGTRVRIVKKTSMPCWAVRIAKID